SRAGSMTLSLMRTCGLSVAAYFFVSESDRYGSISRKRLPYLRRNPLCPNHHRCTTNSSADARFTSARNASSLRTALIMPFPALFGRLSRRPPCSSTFASPPIALSGLIHSPAQSSIDPPGHALSTTAPARPHPPH